MSQFNEYTLREEIEKQWGPAGAHLEVYDKILKAAKSSMIEFPITITTINEHGIINGSITVKEHTAILYTKGSYHILQGEGKEIQIAPSEFTRLWPVIRFEQVVGKRGAFFRFVKART